MKETHIIALIIGLTGLQAGLIFVGILPVLSVNSSANMLFLIGRIAIIGYMGWIFSGPGFKEAAIKGGIVTLVSVITIYSCVFIGIIIHKPVLGLSFESQSNLLFYLLIMGIINVLFGVILALISALIGRKFKK